MPARLPVISSWQIRKNSRLSRKAATRHYSETALRRTFQVFLTACSTRSLQILFSTPRQSCQPPITHPSGLGNFPSSGVSNVADGRWFHAFREFPSPCILTKVTTRKEICCMFTQLIESTTEQVQTRRPLSLIVAMMIHMVLILLLLLVPRLAPETLSAQLQHLTFLITPPPPPSAPRVPAARSQVTFKKVIQDHTIRVPREIPR